MGRSLTERGFVLPTCPPQVGHLRLDNGRWNALALRRVVVDFLAPGIKTKLVGTASNRDAKPGARVINKDASANGFGDNMWFTISAPGSRRKVAAYIGVPEENIWPPLDRPRVHATVATTAPSLAHVSAPTLVETPWQNWTRATRDLIRWWWSIVA